MHEWLTLGIEWKVRRSLHYCLLYVDLPYSYSVCQTTLLPTLSNLSRKRARTLLHLKSNKIFLLSKDLMNESNWMSPA